MNFNRKIKEEVLQKVPSDVRKCLKYTLDKIEKEAVKNGNFLSMEDFVTRMLKANLDIHAFSVLAEYMPMKFPNNGDATMLRTVLSLMGYDPDYSVAPDIRVHPAPYWEEPEDLPFN